MIKIEITKYRVTGKMMGDRIVEDPHPTKLDKYYEQEQEKSTNRIVLSEQKRKFIDKIAREVTGSNRRQERMFKQDSSKPFIKLVITNIS